MGIRPERLKKTDIPSMIVLVILAVLSVLMVGSTTIATDGFWTRYTIVQTLSFCLGAAISVVIVAMDYSLLNGTRKILYVLSLALLALVYVPGLGIEVYGARSWISLGFTTVQPSEVVKILFAQYHKVGSASGDLFQLS